MQSTHRVLRHGRGLVIAIHDSQSPTDEEWGAFVTHCRSLFAKVPDARNCRSLAITDGGAPNAKQRRQMVDLLRAQSPDLDAIISVVVSDNLVVRGVVGAFALFLTGIRIFAPGAITSAVDHIGVAPSERMSIAEELEQMAESLPRARTVRTVIANLREH